MGVLTKPDTIEDSTHAAFIAMLSNNGSWSLQRGWFVVRRPAQKQLEAGISSGEAAELERIFFDSELPWCGADMEGVRHRFGVDQLRAYLSNLLASIIKRWGAWQQRTSQNAWLACCTPELVGILV